MKKILIMFVISGSPAFVCGEPMSMGAMDQLASIRGDVANNPEVKYQKVVSDDEVKGAEERQEGLTAELRDRLSANSLRALDSNSGYIESGESDAAALYTQNEVERTLGKKYRIRERSYKMGRHSNLTDAALLYNVEAKYEVDLIIDSDGLGGYGRMQEYKGSLALTRMPVYPDTVQANVIQWLLKLNDVRVFISVGDFVRIFTQASNDYNFRLNSFNPDDEYVLVKMSEFAGNMILDFTIQRKDSKVSAKGYAVLKLKL